MKPSAFPTFNRVFQFGAAMCAVAACMVVNCASARAADGETAGPARMLNMAQVMELALADNAKIAATRNSREEAEAELDIAKGEYQPRIEFQGLLAPMSGHRMPATYSADPAYATDLGDLGEWGVWTKINVKLYQPIYTGGKIIWLNRARELGVEVEKSKEAMARADVRLEVERGFFALALTRKLVGVIDEGRGYFEKARKHLQELEDSDDPSYDPVDRMKINVYEAQIIEREYQAKRMLALAEGQIRRLIGEDPSSAETGFVTEDEPVPLKLSETVDFDGAVEAALSGRPELVALRTGIKAREAEAEARFRNFFPDFLLFAEFDWAYSNVSDDISYPYYDPFNSLGFGAGLAMRFDLNIGKKIGELKKAKAKKSGLMAELESAELAVRLEIKKLHTEMKDAEAMMAARKTALKSARGWVIAKTDLYENGMSGLQDIIDGLSQFFMAQLAFYQSVYDFNASVAALERTTGIDMVPMTPPDLADNPSRE